MGAKLRFASAANSSLPPCGGGMGWGVVQYGTAEPHLTTPTPAPQGGADECAAAANRKFSIREGSLPPC
jgi:hypothetical protein